MKIELFVALYLAYVRHNGTWICVYNQFDGLWPVYNAGLASLDGYVRRSQELPAGKHNKLHYPATSLIRGK